MSTSKLILDELQRSTDKGEAINLGGRQITAIPKEAIEILKEKVERLSLEDNMINTLPDCFNMLKKLRYLDIHGNKFTEFPSVLCSCESLEILDISFNKISSLPKDMGFLLNLKVLSIKSNKFIYLPPVISQMNHLRILEVENNPLILPPLSITNQKAPKNNPEGWIQLIKKYLHDNQDLIYSKLGAGNLNTNGPTNNNQDSSLNSRGYNNQPATAHPNFPSHSMSHQTSLSTSTSTSNFSRSGTALEQRHRSSSESYVSSRAAKRMGFVIKKQNDSVITSNTIVPTQEETDAIINIQRSSPPPPLPLPRFPFANSSNNNSLVGLNSSATNLSTTSISSPMTTSNHISSLSKRKTHHFRGMSHDSLLDSGANYERNNGIIGDSENSSSAYFKRLSTLSESQQQPHNIIQYTNIIDVSRKLLYVFSQIHSSIRKYTNFCTDKKLAIKMVGLIYNAKSQIDHLVDVLELLEKKKTDKVDPSYSQNIMSQIIDQMINACQICIRTFKQIISTITDHMKTFTEGSDIRYTRTLLLTLFGACNEFHNAWCTLYPPPIHAQQSTVRQLQSILPGYLSIGKSPQLLSLPVSTSMQQPTTPVETKYEDFIATDTKLYESIRAATTTAQTVFAKLPESLSKSAISRSHAQTQGAPSTTPNTDIKSINSTVVLKIAELTSTSLTAMEVTRRLKKKLSNIEKMDSILDLNINDKKLFWEDTNNFLKLVITILACTKLIMEELPLLNEVRPSIAALTKATKEIPIFLEVSSYSHLAQFSNNQIQQQQISNSGELTGITSPLTNPLSTLHLSQRQRLPSISIPGRMLQTPSPVTAIPVVSNTNEAAGSAAGSGTGKISTQTIVVPDN